MENNSTRACGIDQLYEAIVELGPSYVFEVKCSNCAIYKVYIDRSYEKLQITNFSTNFTTGDNFSLNESDSVKYDTGVDRFILSDCTPHCFEDRYMSVWGITDNKLFLCLYIIINAQRMEVTHETVDLSNYITRKEFESSDDMVKYFGLDTNHLELAVLEAM